MAKIIQTTFFILFFPLILLSDNQNIKFEHISYEKGLPSADVNCIMQDSDGFLWIGTKEGLSRYDGYTFVNFTHDPQDSTSISYNSVRCIHEDENGFLWIGTHGGGLNKFNLQNEQFTRYENDQENPQSISSNNITTIVRDKDSNLWIGTESGGLNKFDREIEIFAHFCTHHSLKSELTYCKI